MSGQPLTPEIKAIIKSTAPVLAVHGTAITSTFYPILFNEYPQVCELFNKKNQVGGAGPHKSSSNAPDPGTKPTVGAQPTALANAVYAYAANIDNLGALAAAVSLIAHKHASLHVLPEHYPMVGGSLLKAIKQVLGDAATDEIMNAWAVAYFALADILIGAENKLREENAHKKHGWAGWKEMKVIRKVKESDDVTSFYIGNKDGSSVCSYLPGQYISFRITMPDGSIEERDYSISEYTPARSGDDAASSPPYFRVSIKKIPGGAVSTYFHDHVQENSTLMVGPPYGDFIFTDGKLVDDTPAPRPVDLVRHSHPRPIVFVSAGIGITPVMTMLQSLLLSSSSTNGSNHPARKIHFIYGARDGQHFPFASTLRSLAEEKKVNLHVALSQPKESTGDVLGKTYESKGRISCEVLRAALKGIRPTDCLFYFCGPTDFMKEIRGLLMWLGVNGDQVHYECFGPAVADIDAAGLIPTY